MFGSKTGSKVAGSELSLLLSLEREDGKERVGWLEGGIDGRGPVGGKGEVFLNRGGSLRGDEPWGPMLEEEITNNGSSKVDKHSVGGDSFNGLVGGEISGSGCRVDSWTPVT